MARVRVDRGDGKLFNVNEGPEMVAFVAANPGAKVVGGRAPVAAVTPQEHAATAAQAPTVVTMPRRATT